MSARRKTSRRECVACGCRVSNANLGGHSGESGLTSALWCVRCADRSRQLVLPLRESQR
jgi:hypothetical protein